MEQSYIMREYYIRYLQQVRGVSERTVKHYVGAMKKISHFLIERQKIKLSIYEINDLIELEYIKEYLLKNTDFVAFDERGNRMYSASLNNYLRFAQGEDFKNRRDELVKLDIEMPAQNSYSRIQEYYIRSSIIKKHAIESANYECEIDSKHITFTAVKTKMPYMEGHHAIPICKQESFLNSLDIYANVICLCPTCHRQLHHGVHHEKQFMLDKIYYDRAERLNNSGIRVSKEEFTQLTN